MISLSKLLYVPLCTVLIYAALCFWETLRVMDERQAVNADYPALADLSVCGWALLFMCPARYLSVRYLWTPLGDWLLPSLEKKPHWTEKSRADRVERFATVIFKFAYFVSLTIVGYRFLSAQDWLPSVLGGSGDTKNCWADFPFPAHPPGLRLYYMISLAYHVQSLLFHFMMAHRADFLEMMLHHVCAISLVLFSYYNNYVKIGSVVLFVHDIADVVGYAIKASVDTQYTKVTLTLYVSLLITWGYTRLYVFPVYVLGSIFYEGIELIPREHFHRQSYRYFEGMLYILQCLHIYWYILFWIMGAQFLKSGKTVDTIQNPGKGLDKPIEATDGATEATEATCNDAAVQLARTKMMSVDLRVPATIDEPGNKPHRE